MPRPVLCDGSFEAFCERQRARAHQKGNALIRRYHRRKEEEQEGFGLRLEAMRGLRQPGDWRPADQERLD